MATTESMNTHRKTAVIVAVLFIIATAFLFVGQAFYGPILDAPDYLELAYPQRATVVVGILLEFACIIAIPLIPLFMYPILKKHNEPLALSYVVFRLFEAVLFVITEINYLSLISVSEGYLNSGELDAVYYQILGASIQANYLWIFSIYVLVFAIGSALFNATLYKSKLVPRLISGSGVFAAILIFIGTILILLEVTPAALAAVFFIPIAVQEMVFAVWLIVKGFNREALAASMPVE